MSGRFMSFHFSQWYLTDAHTTLNTERLYDTLKSLNSVKDCQTDGMSLLYKQAFKQWVQRLSLIKQKSSFAYVSCLPTAMEWFVHKPSGFLLWSFWSTSSICGRQLSSSRRQNFPFCPYEYPSFRLSEVSRAYHNPREGLAPFWQLSSSSKVYSLPLPMITMLKIPIFFFIVTMLSSNVVHLYLSPISILYKTN